MPSWSCLPKSASAWPSTSTPARSIRASTGHRGSSMSASTGSRPYSSNFGLNNS